MRGLLALLLSGCVNSVTFKASDADSGGASTGGPVDADHDGYTTRIDCDDTDASVHPSARERCNGVDDDCDTLIDDADPDVVDAPTWHRDADSDGYGDPTDTLVDCAAPYGWVADGTDCDDADAAISPAAVEICNGLDDDCDLRIDDHDADVVGRGLWYPDGDGDGSGATTGALHACVAPPGYVASSDDCDDTDPAVHPAATEVCNLHDDDCDGLVDDHDPDITGQTPWYPDVDADTFGDPSGVAYRCAAHGFVATAGDCDDTLAAVHPGAPEICNAIDDDCDTLVDGDDPDVTGAGTWAPDADADGFGASDGVVTACTRPAGYVADTSDCDDGAASVNPTAVEICNGIDDDCDGLVDARDPDVVGRVTRYADNDADGFGDPDTSHIACDEHDGWILDATDCDDRHATVSPAGTEVCDHLDNDCDGLVDNADSELPDACPDAVYDPENPFLGYAFRGGCYDSSDDPDQLILWSPYADANVEVRVVDASGADIGIRDVTIRAGAVGTVNCHAGEVLRVDSDQPLQVLMAGTTDTSVRWDDDWIGMYGDDLLLRMIGVQGGYGIASYDDGNTVTLTSIDGASTDLETTAVLNAGETLELREFADLGLSFRSDVYLHLESTYPISTVFGMFSDNAGTQLFSGDMAHYLAPIGTGSLTVLVTGGDQAATVTFADLESGAAPVTTAIPAEGLASFTTGGATWGYIDLESDVPITAITEDDGSGFSPAIQYSSLDLPGGVGARYGVPLHKNGPELTIISVVDDNDITLWGCTADRFTLDANAYQKPARCSGASVLMASGTGPFVLDTSYGNENATAWLPVSGDPAP